MRIDNGGALFLAVDLVKRYEGLRLVPYLCPAGKLTVGYGHVIMPGEDDLKAGVSVSEAEGLLISDLGWALFAVRSVGVSLLPCQLAALASLVFNIGPAAWAGSTMRRCVGGGDFVGAAAEFGRWVKVGGVESAGLVARRADELRVFGGSYGLD